MPGFQMLGSGSLQMRGVDPYFFPLSPSDLSVCYLLVTVNEVYCNTCTSTVCIGYVIGYSEENLKIHTGVPSLLSLTFPSLLPLPCLPLPLPLPFPLPSYIPLPLEVRPIKSS